jgi:hypothetical protein
MRNLAAVRKQCPEIGQGELAVLGTGSKSVFAHRCVNGEGTLVALHNLSPDPQEVELDVKLAGLETLLGADRSEIVDGKSLRVSLDGYGYRWLRSERKRR